MADTAFHLALAVGVANATGHGRGPVVGQHVGVERIGGGVVNVGTEDAFAQIIQHDQAWSSAQSTEGSLVQLRPDARSGPPDQETHGLAAVAESEHEHAGAAIPAATSIANHRPGAVVHLALFVMV